jgi:PKD repeat protein
MGRIGAIGARRRALVGLGLVTAVALAACVPLKAPVKQQPPRPQAPAPNAEFGAAAASLVVSFTDQSSGLIKIWS